MNQLNSMNPTKLNRPKKPNESNWENITYQVPIDPVWIVTVYDPTLKPEECG